MTLALDNIYNFALAKVAKQTFIKDYRVFCRSPMLGRALLYYKTEPFIPGYWDRYRHTNFWEVKMLARVLNELGFWVDLLDRSATEPPDLRDNYTIFIANASGDSGKLYSQIAKQLPSAIKVFYATTAHPEVHNQRITKRYQALANRTGYSLPAKRVVQKLDIDEALTLSDYIISLGSENANRTYLGAKKKIFRVFTSVSPAVHKLEASELKRDLTQWLFFAGSGNIVKGLDLVLEAFADLPGLTLHVCTKLEPETRQLYGPLLARSQNIEVHGVIPVGTGKFRDLTSFCAYVILPSATEAFPTSLSTCLHRGLVPVTTPEVGLQGVGELLPSDPSVEEIKKVVQQLSEVDVDLFEQYSQAAQSYAQDFSQQGFQYTVRQALEEILQERDKLQFSSKLKHDGA